MSEEKKRLVLMVTHGPEQPELATVPLVMATTALASDIDVLIGFQGNGVFLAMKGMAERVSAHGFPAIKDLLQSYVEAGGKMYVCAPCAASRKITPEDLIEGAEIVGGATFVSECVAATNVLVY